MRTGISLTVSSIDHQRLAALVRDHNAQQKHVWRAEIILLSADGIGTVEIMQQTGKSKTVCGAGRSASAPKASRDCCATRRGARSCRSGPSVWWR